MSAFSNVTPEVVDRMPWIPDGDHIYIIRCEEDYWHDKQIDGRPWQMMKSSRTGLVGIKKFGACRGSFICLNDDCPIYTAKHIRNRVDFMKENFGAYSCSNCKVFVQCRQCNARKVTEFDQKDNVLTIYHQGKHTCTPKPNVEEQRQVAAEKHKELPPLNLELRNTPREFQIDLIRYYIATGQLEKGKELAELLSHKRLLEQIKYGNLDGIVRDITGGRGQSEVDTFKNVGKLKSGADEFDRCYIYKINCRSINSEPSFVFKSSKMAAQLALKMDINLQHDEEASTMVEEYAYMDAMHTRVKGYKTLTLWTYHHGMQHVMRLATMEAERENTEFFSLFLTLWNNLLAEVSGIPGYKFNP